MTITVHQVGTASLRKAGHLLAVSALATALSLAFPHAVYAQPAAVDLGTLPCCDGGSVASAVNAHGQVVGESWYSWDWFGKAFSWTEADGMVDLGTLGGLFSGAYAVNDNGQVVGWADLADDYEWHAFSWTQSGGMVDLGTLGGLLSYAIAVNAGGQVIGSSTIAGEDSSHAFSWTPAGGMVDLGTLGGTDSFAIAVNANGQVVGYSSVAGRGAFHAFSWAQTGGMVDLGTLGGTFSFAYAVNANGQVVGYSAIAGDVAVHAFSWTQAGGMVDLGTLGGTNSSASAVNDNGQVVGSSAITGDGGDHAFSWTQAGGMQDLDPVGGANSYSQATVVNALGQVVGHNWTTDGRQYVFSWTETSGMVRLGSLGGGYDNASAVNDKGQVVGYSLLPEYAGDRATLWNVPVVAAVSVSPNAGAGSTQIFSLQYTDSLGASDFRHAWVWFNATLPASSANSCIVYYDRLASTLYLLNDAETQWLPGTLGSGTTLQNSQCAVALAGTSVALNDTTLTLVLAMTFTPSYAGTKNLYLFGASTSGVHSGWQDRGDWIVPTVLVDVTADSASPASGTGFSQTFALRYSDTLGATNLSNTWVWFNATFPTTSTNSCLIHYDRVAARLYLLNDGTSWMWGTLGAGATLQNSQCAVSLSGSSVVLSGTTLTLNLAMTFDPSYAGDKNIYMFAGSASGINSGWQDRGDWTIPVVSVIVTADSATPSSGAGLTQTFALRYSDTLGATNLSNTWVWFNATFATTSTNSCLIYYDRVAARLYLLNDGTTWMSGTLGAGTTLQNSQCAVSLSSSSVVLSGTTLTLNLAMTFEPSYAGDKNIYMFAGSASGVNSGWQDRGDWTVPIVAPTVTANAERRSGMAQTLNETRPVGAEKGQRTLL